jgi:peptidoglycan hydrolase-like protein with peptidoglycan-binding domain
MENIGYLHLASIYETLDETLANVDSATVGVDSTFGSRFKNWKNLSSYAVIRFLPVFLSLAVVNLVGQTLTAQKAAAAISATTTQQCLKKLGYFRGPVTGNYGSLTQSAVTRFQKANGLPAIGTVGPRTEQLLRSQCNRGGGSNNSGDLRLGSSGAAVSNLQRNLQRLGYYNGPVNGNFGQLTQAAVIRFQRANGINADGVVGSRTLDAIRGGPIQPTPPYTGEGGTYDPFPDALNFGDRGSRVRQLQEDLRQLNFFTVNPTSNFGPATRDAVINFQRSQGLTPNGVADSQTLARIAQVLGRTPGNFNCSPQLQDVCVGERSNRVILIQQRLQQWRFFNGNVDGYYGPETRDAVAQFQQSQRLNPTGFVDFTTWQALQITNDPKIGYPPVTPPVADQSNKRYVVVIPVAGNDTLNRVRQILPQAVQATSGRGDYINAGAFIERSDAERLTRQLRDRGFDARVSYF